MDVDASMATYFQLTQFLPFAHSNTHICTHKKDTHWRTWGSDHGWTADGSLSLVENENKTNRFFSSALWVEAAIISGCS